MGVLKGTCWLWGVLGASGCRCVLPGVDNPFVRGFKEVDCKKSWFSPLLVALHVVAMSKIPVAVELFQFPRSFELFLSLFVFDLLGALMRL